jgi:integrase
MSASYPIEPGRRIHVWVQPFKGREHLMLQWHDPETGKRKSKSSGTSHRGLAEMKATELAYELNHGLHQEASRMSWEKFRGLFEEEYLPDLRPKSRRRYGEVLDRFERLCQPRTLAGVNERTLSALVAAMRKEVVKGRVGFAPATIRHTLVILHAALEWAVRQKFLPAVPAAPEVTVPKKRPQPVAVEAFERIYAKAQGDPQMQAYLLTGWLAGLRLEEAYQLEWEPADKAPWVDALRRRIWLPAEFVKAGRDEWLPVDPELWDALDALPRRGRKVFHFADGRGRVISPGGVSKRVRDLARRAGLKLSMHTLRKGFGCRYAGRVPAQVLQKLMRHANIRTTMDFYANVDAAVEEAVFGPRCNTSRNTPAPNAPEPSTPQLPDDSLNPNLDSA